MTKTRRQALRRHQPTRMCVACRESRPKRELVRIIRSADGAISIDPSGKLAGRGAYLCRQRSCWELALKRKTLDHALKMTLSVTDVEGLAAFAQELAQAHESCFCANTEDRRTSGHS